MPRLSRALLHAGPLAPLSHLGATLLRHVVGSGLRWALYQLGLPLPAAPPLRLVRLRLYLEADLLADLLAGAPGGAAVAAALVDPGGRDGPLPPRLAGAARFHRLRLRLRLGPSRRGVVREDRGSAGAGPSPGLWQAFHQRLTRGLAATNDALMADLLAALARRRRRAAGHHLPPCLGGAARRCRAGRRTDLRRLGAPDPRQPSWAETPERAAAAVAALAAEPLPPADPLRGRFREAYRVLLDELRGPYLGLAADAAARGLLDGADDAWFLPLETAHDLALPRAAWVGAAVAANRAEHDALRRAPEPDVRLDSALRLEGPSGERPEWDWAPLLPLP